MSIFDIIDRARRLLSPSEFIQFLRELTEVHSSGKQVEIASKWKIK